MKTIHIVLICSVLVLLGCSTNKWESDQLRYSADMMEELPKWEPLQTNAQIEKSKDKCNELIHQEPRFASAHAELANLYAEQGLFEEAIKEVDIAIRMMEDGSALWGERHFKDTLLPKFKANLDAYRSSTGQAK